MNDTVNRVLDVSSQLRQMKDRLTELDSERADLQKQIAQCMDILASAFDGHRATNLPSDASMADQVLAVLARNNHPLSPLDVADMLELRRNADIMNVRTLLSRMARDGRATKVSHGRYVARRA